MGSYWCTFVIEGLIAAIAGAGGFGWLVLIVGFAIFRSAASSTNSNPF